MLLLLACTAVPVPTPERPWGEVAPGSTFAESPPGPADGLAEGYRRGTIAWLDRGVGQGDFHTGAELFDAEWLYGTYMMAAAGFGAHARAHPEARAEDLRHLERALDRLLEPDTRAFDTRSWGEDPLESLAGERGHAAWLGYTGVALGAHRLLVPESRYTAIHEAVVEAIERRLDAAPDGLVETYPGEWYPVDNAAMVGALGLHTRATGTPHPAIGRWVARARAEWVRDGLLVQSVRDGRPADHPRGSGTFLASWFLHPADPAFAGELYRAGRDRLMGSAFGVPAMREYPPGVDGRGDIDSGPIVLGFGVSSTGFAIGAGLLDGDAEMALALAGTARSLGGMVLALDPSLRGPTDAGSHSGSHIGDAILFAMTASRPVEPL